MELERDHFKELFSQQDDSNWNTQEPMTGHRERFMARLENSADTPKKSTFNWLEITFHSSKFCCPCLLRNYGLLNSKGT